ncbi:MAG: hypothetical protein QM739_13695 [Propionivibrio sp.]
MAFVTVVVAADEDECAAVGDAVQPLNEWSGVEIPGLDIPKMATLHCLLTGDRLDSALDAYEPAYISANNAVVLRVADSMAERLASVDDDALDAIAAELVATEEFERDHSDPDDALDLLNELAGLAQLAESQGQILFVWMRFE